MLTTFSPGPDSYDESWMLGTIFSAMAYGVVLTLMFCCLQLLLANTSTPSKRVRHFLFAYIATMVALSTASMVAAIYSIDNAIFTAKDESFRVPLPTLPVKSWGTPFIVLATWGADGFMLWRCAILYADSPRRVLFLGLMTVLALISLGSGILFLVLPFDKGWLLLSFVFITAIVNVTLASLVAYRLIDHRNRIRRVLGAGHASTYTRVIQMCVESSALIVVFNIAYLVLDFSQFLGTVILINLLVHIYVISPFLIIYRVAQGKAVVSLQDTVVLGDLEAMMDVPRSPIRFNHRSQVSEEANDVPSAPLSGRTSTLPTSASTMRRIL